GCFRHPETHLLREIDALNLRLQRNFKMLSVRGHLLRCDCPRVPNVTALWVTQQRKASQWSRPAISYLIKMLFSARRNPQPGGCRLIIGDTKPACVLSPIGAVQRAVL